MGMDVAGSEVAQANGEAKAIFNGNENGSANASEPIKFGSHGFEEQQSKVDAVTVSKANAPTNAADEWPDAPKIHSFWVVKYRTYDDPTLKAKIDQVDREIQKINQRTGQITEQLKPKRAARVELKEKLMALASENSQYGAVLSEKRQEMKPLQEALGALRGSGGPVGICSTEKELNDVIRSLEYKMQHESLTLKEEKQLIRDIKELEATRPKVVANTARRAKIQDSLGKTEVIQDQVKLLGTDLDEVRKQRATLKARMDNIGQQVKVIDAEIAPLQTEYTTLDGKRKQTFETIWELRSKRDEGNACFYQNRNFLNGVRDLASKKDLKALEELVHAEVEKFMSQWNSSKAFRDDYEKRILLSLDMRQLSRDGRIRNFDEKPLVKTETPRNSQAEVAPKAAANKPKKEEAKASVEVENSSVQKAEKEAKKNNKEVKNAPVEATKEEEEVFMVEKPKKTASKENETDVAKLKEMKREEEKEKQRQAFERKKKLQEKGAAKAAVRALKEAEKKQQKKLKKKESTSAPPTNDEDPTETEAEAAEQEKDIPEEAVETSDPPLKPKVAKKNTTLKNRKTTATKTRGPLPKAILKKKKSDNYLIWGAYAAAAAVVMILLYLAFTYLL